MPVAYVRKLAHKHGTSVSTAERRWKNAKASAAKQGHGDDYGYITGIFKNMMNEGIDTYNHEADFEAISKKANKIGKKFKEGSIKRKDAVEQLDTLGFEPKEIEEILDINEAEETPTKKYHEDVRLRQRQVRKVYKDMEAKGKVNKKEFIDHLVKELGMKPDQADFWYWDIAEPKTRNASVSSKEDHRAPAKPVKADADEPEEMTAEDAPSFKEFLIMEKDTVKALVAKAKRTKYNFKTIPNKKQI